MVFHFLHAVFVAVVVFDSNIIYSLTSPYEHLYNTDTSVKPTIGSAPLVSILRRFDCMSP